MIPSVPSRYSCSRKNNDSSLVLIRAPSCRATHGKSLMLVHKNGVLQLINKSSLRDCMQYRSIYLSAEVLFSRSMNSRLIPLQLETLGCFLEKLHKKIDFPIKSVREGEKLGNTSFLGP